MLNKGVVHKLARHSPLRRLSPNVVRALPKVEKVDPKVPLVFGSQKLVPANIHESTLECWRTPSTTSKTSVARSETCSRRKISRAFECKKACNETCHEGYERANGLRHPSERNTKGTSTKGTPFMLCYWSRTCTYEQLSLLLECSSGLVTKRNGNFNAN